MVKVERTAEAPVSLAIEKAKKNGSYRCQDVVDQLYADFHGKCYLCEMADLQSIQVEHLLPHHNGKDIDRKFDWHNLFLSCSHCNSVKNRKKYECNVIDCCKYDPETIIKHELLDGKVRVSPLEDSIEARTTAALVQDCFELRNTAIRTLEAQVKVNELKRVMTILYNELDSYRKDKSSKSLSILNAMLDRKYKFAGFTRAYVRDHIESYPDLKSAITL